MKLNVSVFFTFLALVTMTGNCQSTSTLGFPIPNWNGDGIYKKFKILIFSQELMTFDSEIISENKNSEDALKEERSLEGIDLKTAILVALAASFLSLVISLFLLLSHLIKKRDKVTASGSRGRSDGFQIYPFPDNNQKNSQISPEIPDSNFDDYQGNEVEFPEHPPRFEQVTNMRKEASPTAVNHDVFVTDYSDYVDPGFYVLEDFQTTPQNNSYFRISFDRDRNHGRISINTDGRVNFDPILNNTDRLTSICEFIPDPSKAYVSIKEIAPGEIVKDSSNYRVKTKIKIKLIEG